MDLPRRSLPSLDALLDELAEVAADGGTPLAEGERPVVEAALEPAWQALRALDDEARGWQLEAMERGYLTSRVPLAFASNCVRIFHPDPRGLGPLERAALLAVGARTLHRDILAGRLEPDRAGDRPLEMRLYESQLASSRHPGPERDNHCICEPAPLGFALLHRGRICWIPLQRAGADLSAGDVLATLRVAVAHAGEAQAALLGTALPRDRWAAWRGQLAEDSANRDVLDALDRALFVLALDDAEPSSPNELITASRDEHQHNRWYDKGTQLLVFANGEAALNYEHSLFDGSNANRLVSELYRTSTLAPVPGSGVAQPFRALGFALVDERTAAQAAAWVEARRAERAPNTFTDVHPGLGRGDFRALGVSSDATMQVAIHLACARTWGRVLSQNEAVNMRQFAWGRYDTIRTTTAAVRALVGGWDHGTAEVRADLLRDAIGSLRQRVRQSKRGTRGVLALTTLLELRAELERSGVEDGWSLEGLHEAHPGLSEALYCSVSTSNPGLLPGLRLGAFNDLGDKVGLMYFFADHELRVHGTCQGVFAGRSGVLREALTAALWELFAVVAEHAGRVRG